MSTSDDPQNKAAPVGDAKQQEVVVSNIHVSLEVFRAAARIMTDDPDVHYPGLRFSGFPESYGKFQEDVSLVAEVILQIAANSSPPLKPA